MVTKKISFILYDWWMVKSIFYTVSYIFIVLFINLRRWFFKNLGINKSVALKFFGSKCNITIAIFFIYYFKFFYYNTLS